MNAPMIGITLDSEGPGGYSADPWYAQRRNYCDAVAAAGGVPVLLPHHPDLAEAMTGRLDGLVVAGGAFDIDPALYGADRHPTTSLKTGRTAFELAILTAALAAGLPVLGICGGEQLLAVALGGTLIQHIPDTVPNALAHEQAAPARESSHWVTVIPGTILAELADGANRLAVNSRHHQAVASVPAPLTVMAHADDGVVEAIADPTRQFAVGVQWHPEYGINPVDRALFTALVAAARR